MTPNLPPPPENPTQCTMYWVRGAWRIWCEIDLAGPCEGCLEVKEVEDV